MLQDDCAKFAIDEAEMVLLSGVALIQLTPSKFKS